MLEEVTSSERATRSVAKLLQPSIIDLPTRKRKPLTAEELEERRKKREENAAKKARLKEEKERMKEEARKKRLETLWKENNYNSRNIVLNEDDDDESVEESSGEEEEERLAIEYVKGDVTQPINNTGNPAIIVHCVDDSGTWGKGGLFSAISRRSSASVNTYELAGSMEDLHLGDAHLIPFTEDEDDRTSHQNYLALIVAQSRDKHYRLLPMNLSALSEGLERVHQAAKQLNASVHLPRIGHSTPGFNWYGTERLIRKHLASRGIPTKIYYYPRRQPVVSNRPEMSSSDESSDETNETTSIQTRPKPKQNRLCSESASSVHFLPDVFTGVHAFFQGVDQEKAKRLARYVVAYNGNVECLLSDDVTHIVSDRKDSEYKQGTQDTIVVQINWLEDCIRKQRLLDTSKYLLN